ncbi:uncharacterized protein EV420DRAFT_1644283 [Desarmillaria tabescens]|uniref:Uncharacterized protein n=1 Tax=Armillaria tabescens TaxID=1929756 RepID=A0AA39N406_ARMTA|nr:uncharacterized protein EV420DRAFT_1644283 [Desarmillaria tabescens]KAK0457127.1 hypothetical protein EV420DRAFT_1644283 [Desarmillaria tabescens]
MQTWAFLLPKAACHGRFHCDMSCLLPSNETLPRKLIEDRSVNIKLVKRCKRIFLAAWAYRRRRATAPMRWDDVFAVPLNVKHTNLWIAGGKVKTEIALVTQDFCQQSGSGERYKGPGGGKAGFVVPEPLRRACNSFVGIIDHIVEKHPQMEKERLHGL